LNSQSNDQRNGTHICNAIARFQQVKDVTDALRDVACKRVKIAAKKYGVTQPKKADARLATVVVEDVQQGALTSVRRFIPRSLRACQYSAMP